MTILGPWGLILSLVLIGGLGLCWWYIGKKHDKTVKERRKKWKSMDKQEKITYIDNRWDKWDEENWM